MPTLEQLRASARALQVRLDAIKEARAAGTPVSEATMEKFRADHRRFADDASEYKLEEGVRRLGNQLQSDPERLDGSGGGGLYESIQAAGFNRTSSPVVSVPFGDVGFRAAASFDGDYGLNGNRVDVPAPPLGADSRFLYPSLRTENVDSDTTSVASFRQKSRTLPAPLSTMVRDIAATSTKPETDTVTELLAAELKQIATIESAVPNIMLESQTFRGFINDDLRFAYSSAIDAHVVSQIDVAGPEVADPGLDLLESILMAAEAVMANGYSPSILAASPETLLRLLVLKQSTSDDYIAGAMDSVLSGLKRVAVTGLDNAYVIDPGAAGVFHVSPVSFKAFEENSGKTNTSTVRIESNGLFVVQRVGAISEVNGGS